MADAARVPGRAASHARALRTNAPEAQDAIAGTLRDEALRVLAWKGVPSQARDDLAQAVTVTVLARIVEGAVQPGFEDGCLAVAAKNRARDWHREASGVCEKTETYDEDFLLSATPDPYAVLELAEDERHTHALVEKVAQVLRNTPARYKAVLEAVYLAVASRAALDHAEKNDGRALGSELEILDERFEGGKPRDRLLRTVALDQRRRQLGAPRRLAVEPCLADEPGLGRKPEQEEPPRGRPRLSLGRRREQRARGRQHSTRLQQPDGRDELGLDDAAGHDQGPDLRRVVGGERTHDEDVHRRRRLEHASR